MSKIEQSAWEKGYVEFWGSADPVLAIQKLDNGLEYLLAALSPMTAEKGTVAFAKHKDKHALLKIAIVVAHKFSDVATPRKVYHLTRDNKKTLMWEDGQNKSIEFPED